MIDISKKDILDIIFELTHIKDEEGNDIPHFCFASDLAMDLDAKEEEIAVIAAKEGYKIYKVFPGETMVGGIILLADGATLEPVEAMYKDFYGEMPDIIKMELDDEDHLVEVEDKPINEEKDSGEELKNKIRKVIDKYKEDQDSKLGILEVEPGNEAFIHHYDGEDVDFGPFTYHPEGEHEDEYGTTPALITFTLTGGLNGWGELSNWGLYLENVSKLFKELEKETGLHIEIQDIANDIPDDVWTAQVLMYKKETDLEESLNRLVEAFKNKRPKIKKVGDPNAMAMWGRTRSQTFKPKKGKGSFTRHPKHKIDEVFVTPEQSDVDELLSRIKDAGFIIESTREESSGFRDDDDEAKDIHIQVYDATIFGNPETQTAQEIYDYYQPQIEERFRKLSKVCIDFDEEHENKYHLTYSSGFGGKARDGTDCTGRVSAGIDIRAYWLEPNAVDIGEDLDLDVHDLNEFIFAGEDEFCREIEEKAKTVGATIDYYDRVCPNRTDAFWYEGTVADIQFPNEGLGIEVITSGENKFTLDGDTIRYPQDLEERGIYTDDQLYEADNDGRVDWDMNSWWDFRVYLLEDEQKGEYGGDMGYDCMSDLVEALDVPGYLDVIADFKENWLGDLTQDINESKKKKNPLKAAAKRHAKTDKKGAMGWFIAPNVEQSIQHFNHVANGSAESTISAPAGLGEDLDLDVTDKYEWEYDLASDKKYRTVGYKFDDAEQIYTGEKYWYTRIPETCMKVSRKNYKTNALLTMPKNANVMKGVDEFFKAHPSAKYCIIGCKDISRGFGRYVNAWRVLLEESALKEEQNDYWVLSDGKNPRNSNVYAEIEDIDAFIDMLEASNPQKYWELLHYVDGEPIRVWSTDDMKKKRESLTEGCWGMPHTLEQVNKLKNLMMKPVDAFEVGDSWDFKNDELGIGDDELFDRIGKYRHEHPYGSKESNDVRKVIQDFIKDEVLPNWDGYSYSQTGGNNDGETWETGVKEVFQEIADLDLKKLAKENEKEKEEAQKEAEVKVEEPAPEVTEDLELDVMKAPRSPSGIRFEARPREDFMTRGSWRGYYHKRYPEFKLPANGKQIFKAYYNAGRYMLCKAAEKVVSEFFKENPRNQYCVLLAYDKDNKPVTVGQGDDGLFGMQLSEAAEKHDTLNPKLWDEANNLKPEVREKILEIVKEFTDGLEEDEIKFKVDDIVLVGSNCSYNYNDKSDLDVHIRMDTDSLECPDDLYPLLYSAYRSLFNNKFDIDFYGIPVEIYVETSETEQMNDEPLGEARKQSALKSNGIFSVLNNKWIKEPVAEDIPEVDVEAFDKEFEKWESRYLDIIGDASFELDSTEEIVEAATEKIRFHYNGPLYRFEHLFRRNWDAYTEAVSFKKAVNNFNAKAKEEFGFTYEARLNIDPKYVEVVETEEDDAGYDEPGEGNGRCEICGRYLNDSGECPLCDLGDESVLEEDVNKDTIEDIEDFIEDIYDLRKTSIATEGEYGIGNLVFKECRNRGYLDNLKELKNALKSKELSLESLQEHLTKYQISKKLPEITEEKVKSWINDDAGWDMTIDPDTLDKADFSKLPKGWIVTQNFGLDNLFDPKDYEGMTKFIKKILLEYGDRFYIGTYKMKYGKHRGKIAIDVNRIIKNTREAIIDGVENLQESIYRYDEYIFLTHNLISRRTGKKKPDPLSIDELKTYDLDGCIVDEPIDDCMSIELVTGVFPTDIPAIIKK